MISFLMMAYNEEKYIKESILKLQKESNIDWELIVIDDFSEDNTFSIVENLAKDDFRIKICRNIEKGKVVGTNYAYSLSRGEIIKCIDADDILENEFFQEYSNLLKFDAHCHNSLIVDENLNFLAKYSVNPLIINKDFEYVLKKFIVIPKAYWSFKREIAEKVFPIPSDIPFEDVWISFLIKKYSKNILHIKKPLYLYRQHTNQVFGGILNFDYEKMNFRAKRFTKFINVVETNKYSLIENIQEPFEEMKEYSRIILSRSNILKILITKLSFSTRIKLILILHFPEFTKKIIKIKWRFDDRTK